MDIHWGWVKDPRDSRDFPARRLVVTEMPLPSRYFVNPDTVIYDQGSEPACVGYAGAGVKTDEEFTQYRQQVTFNGLWLYRECKKVDGIPNIEGTYPRVALKILQETGMRESGGLCITRKPDGHWRIKGYFRIDPGENREFVRQVIYQFGSIMVGSTWYASWMAAGVVMPEPDRPTGGHAYRICGWDEDGFIVVNSWGQFGWGVAGRSIMPWEMFEEVVLQEGDCWKLIDA